MSYYPPAINDRLRAPKRAGDVAGSNAAATRASFVCGAFARLKLNIDAASGSISDAKFHSNGCGFMIAAADVVCEWLRNKQLADLHGLSESVLREVVERDLDSYPPERQQCSGVVFDALRTAMAEYHRDRIDEFRGENALICSCFGVSEQAIIKAISLGGLTDVDDVSRVCRAGSGCGSCIILIRELIDSSTM